MVRKPSRVGRVRVVSIPQDFKRALARNKQAHAAFTIMPYSHKKEYVAWITKAKRIETRKRRIQKALAQLAEKK